MTFAELLRFLKRHGCQFEERSKHTLVIRGSLRTMIPRHSSAEVKPGTLHSILKQLGLKK